MSWRRRLECWRTYNGYVLVLRDVVSCTRYCVGGVVGFPLADPFALADFLFWRSFLLLQDFRSVGLGPPVGEGYKIK